MNTDRTAGTDHSESLGEFYSSRKARYEKLLSAAERNKNNLSNVRLVTAVCTLAVTVLFYRVHMQTASVVSLITGILVFAVFLVRHTAIIQKANEYRALVTINHHGMLRLKGRWHTIPDEGGEYTDQTHPYTSDLDIFGNGSLFQYCSTAHTFRGRAALAGLLANAFTDDASLITRRQAAVAELKEKPDWRQLFECCACEQGAEKDPVKLCAWGEARENTGTPGWVLKMLLPVQTVTALLIGASIVSTVFIFPAVCMISLQLIVTVFFTPGNLKLFKVFDKSARGLSAYSRLVNHIASESFTSDILGEQQSTLGEDGARGAMKALARIAAATEVRYAPVPWFIANALFLWDFRCVKKLERWRTRFGGQIRGWVEAVGIFEAFSSLAMVRFTNPAWVVPAVEPDAVSFRAEAMGHPLLMDSERVHNDVRLGNTEGNVALITGSNMSGKSTFLRTVGCNLVLAYAGCAVCARSLSTGMFRLCTSMRTGDDLKSHTSTFYAELLRVKMIVDIVRMNSGRVLYLLDELFRGTNSADRHDGAVALLEELSRTYTLGCVATHDLDLCRIPEQNPQYRNFHFREHYEDNEIRFDYRLYPGPSTTRNALYLMRMVGIMPSAEQRDDDA